MSLIKMTRTELRYFQQLGRLCESHARDAARCSAAGKAAVAALHAHLARSYSRNAFALARRVYARQQA